jgi:RNA polymerase sigma-70 factor (subfamily 1)
MPPTLHEAGADLERFRAYLSLLGRLGLGPLLRARVDVSGVVQDTLLEAFQAGETFFRLSEAQKPLWLRRVLANNLKDTIAALRTGKRDIRREQALAEALDASSARCDGWLASDDASPSEIAMLHEDQVRLAWALEQLSAERRTAVELHSLQGLTLEETAWEMGKTKAAVAQLYSRAVKELNALLDRA